jgi:hypothetical protein
VSIGIADDRILQGRSQVIALPATIRFAFPIPHSVIPSRVEESLAERNEPRPHEHITPHQTNQSR